MSTHNIIYDFYSENRKINPELSPIIFRFRNNVTITCGVILSRDGKPERGNGRSVFLSENEKKKIQQ